MFTVYILQSTKTRRYYIGHTEDLDHRVRRHNAGAVPVTRHGIPWTVVYTEQKLTRAEAFQREHEVKRYHGGVQFKKLIGLCDA